jgi:hypothetical protein
MAKVTLTNDILRTALAAHCEKNGLAFSESEKNGSVGFVIMPGDICLACENGKLVCPDRPTWEALSLTIAEMAEVPVKGSNLPAKQGNGITSRSQAGSRPGSALETVQRTAEARPKTYRAGGQEEAFAVEKIKAFQEMGGSYEIRESEVSRDHARYLIRGTLPSGRFDEAEYVVFRDQWMQDMAWDMVDKQMEKFNNCILDFDNPATENQMPNLLKGAMMKVRKQDDVSNKVYDVPAAYHIATTVNKLWKFQRIQAQTKCKAKIAKELAGALDMLESGEQEDEDRERSQVAGGKA